jgi:CheY-like chemotaxis protein
VVEDNPVNQKVALVMVRRLGYEADVAGTGTDALAAVHAVAYDVVLMDLYMPEMDGLEATRRIRSEVPTSRQPIIIAMTANVTTEDRRHCLEAGMDAYLPKPVRMEDLAAALERSDPQFRAAADLGAENPADERHAAERTPPVALAFPVGRAVYSPGPLGDTDAMADAGAPSDTAASGPRVSVDIELLAAFVEQIGGRDDNDRTELIGTYLHDADQRIKDLKAAAELGDAEGVARAAHGLRSGSALLGALPLAELLQQFETMARIGSRDLQSIGEQIEAEYDNVTSVLEQIRRPV